MEERYGWFKRPGPNVLRGPVVSITLTIFEQSWKLQKCHNLESSNIGLDGSKDFAQMSWSGRWYAVGITLVIFEQGWKLKKCHNLESSRGVWMVRKTWPKCPEGPVVSAAPASFWGVVSILGSSAAVTLCGFGRKCHMHAVLYQNTDAVWYPFLEAPIVELGENYIVWSPFLEALLPSHRLWN